MFRHSSDGGDVPGHSVLFSRRQPGPYVQVSGAFNLRHSGVPAHNSDCCLNLQAPLVLKWAASIACQVLQDGGARGGTQQSDLHPLHPRLQPGEAHQAALLVRTF